MVSILDIAPVGENVTIGGKEWPVHGLSITDLRDMMVAFPDAGALLGEGVNAGTLLARAPDLVAAAICLSLGFKGTKEERESVSRWPAGEQVKVLNVIIKLSAPDGVGPFVELVQSLVAGAEGVDVEGLKASATNSARRSRGASVLATKPMT